MRHSIRTLLFAATALAGVGSTAGSAQSGAQSGAQTVIEGRVDRLEREMKAVQRTVFPGGAGKFVSPEITGVDASVAVPGTPATSPVADLDARLVALERQQATLTGQIEQNQNRIRQLEDAFAAYKRTGDARLGALEQGATTPGTSAAPRPAGETVRPSAAASTGTTRPASARPSATPTRPAADPERATRLAAVERPKTDDAAEDGYLYGYRLWDAKLYPEAETALKGVVDTYPKHRRASFSQNLLGRAYLDEGRPSLASMAFYDSFKKYPDGERAPDSLYYLAQSLMKLDKPADACKVYAELDASYASKITPQMRANVTKGRAAAKCK